MRTIRAAEIIIPPRQRRKIDTTELNHLKDSIRANGLIHPILVRYTADGIALVAGERRLRAILSMGETGEEYLHDTQVILPGEIPATFVSDLSLADLMQLELDENEMRSALPWQDKVDALAALHAARQEENKNQTFIATARELKAKADTPLTEGAIERQVRQAVVVKAHMDNPTIAKARSAKEAYNLALKAEEEEITARLARRKAEAFDREATVAVRPSIEVLNGDSNEILRSLPGNRFDLILADPPYGIGVSGAGLRRRTVHHHNYDDSPEVARSLIQTILLEGHRTTKASANLLMFLDIDIFDWAKKGAQNAGWTVFRTPIIWQKSRAEGLAPWGRQGFIRTYEIILFATKNQRGLLRSPLDILHHSRVGRHERIYGAEKPVPLLRELIEVSTLPGDEVLDPCCGSGSTLAAAHATKRKALGIEVDKSAFNIASTRIYNLLQGTEDVADIDLLPDVSDVDLSDVTVDDI